MATTTDNETNDEGTEFVPALNGRMVHPDDVDFYRFDMSDDEWYGE